MSISFGGGNIIVTTEKTAVDSGGSVLHSTHFYPIPFGYLLIPIGIVFILTRFRRRKD
jgi:hypothetical protein